VVQVWQLDLFPNKLCGQNCHIYPKGCPWVRAKRSVELQRNPEQGEKILLMPQYKPNFFRELIRWNARGTAEIWKF